MDERSPKKFRFWPLLGMILGGTFVLALLYTALVPGISGRALSDSLCVSALLLGILSILPLLLDTGRGIKIASEMSADEEERHEAMAKERRKREQGMTISFAVAAATILLVVISLIIGLL